MISVTGVLAGLLLAPGTAAGEEEVRIALVSGRESIRVGGRALTLFDGDVGDAIARFSGDESVTLVASDGQIRVRGESDARIEGARRIIVEAEDAVRVDDGVYFGRIEVRPQTGRDRRLIVINRLKLETYLLGIVGSEMSPSWPIEALKAQAVAARTYAMQRRAMMRAANEPYDLASTVISQVYKGAERIRPSVIEAVRSTRGEVLAHRHALVEALFHSTCGGETVAAEDAFGNDVRYLRPRRCQWCGASPRHRWSLTFPLSEVSRKLRAAGLVRGAVEELARSRRARRVTVEDDRGRRRLDPRDVRRALGFGRLYSERFEARTGAGRVRFEGRGFGHGVGMCQWGARGMALDGQTYRQILEHYYAGARVKRIY